MPETGDLIGPYRLISQLGKGAMGEVWRARDERLDRYVALKVLPAHAADDLERRARMLREARAAAAIRHPNVVTLFDIVAHDGEDILVMELVEGKTLSDVLRKDGAPPLETALAWIHGIAEALTAAHARGILHRDIKAANIMVTPDGIKVLDFGLAKVLDALPAGAGPIALSATPIAHGAVATSKRAAAVDASALDATIRGEPIAATGLDDTLHATPRVEASGVEATLHASDSQDRAATTQRDRPSARETLDLASYRTHAGALLGTPLYMAPEQVAGALPDERSEVFSVGVLAHEILRGKPPYSATTMDKLFAQITNDTPPPLDDVPTAVAAIVTRALAKDPAQRHPTMAALRDELAAVRKRLYAPKRSRWPLAVAAGVLVLGGAAAIWYWRSHRALPVRPGDEYVKRALEEYDVFYNDKALSSLRAALAVAPAHPRANAYLVLFGGAPQADVDRAVAAAHTARDATDEHTKDRALLDTAIALAEHGPRAAREALTAAGADTDRELAFWAAELDYRAGQYTVARDEYHALLAEPAAELRGRIYDHDSSVLLYLDEPDEALRIGTLYRDAFPGEADAVGVYATTLAAAGQLDKAVAAAEEALRLSEGEDTLAGLGKVVALAGDRARAKDLYQRSLDRAGPSRRPVRRAALGFLQWIDGDAEHARATVAPCLAGGADSSVRERGPCLFVAGLVDPAHAADAADQLDALAAAATETQPAYGAPASLAKLVRAAAVFNGGGCLVDTAPQLDAALEPALLAAYATPLDFFAAYHVPFFATWPLCEHAALLTAKGDKAGAAALLRPVAERAPNRGWLVRTLAKYR